jgi:hypothetical protein
MRKSNIATVTFIRVKYQSIVNMAKESTHGLMVQLMKVNTVGTKSMVKEFLLIKATLQRNVDSITENLRDRCLMRIMN